MRRSLYFITLFLLHAIFLSGQSDFIANPSFEDYVGKGHIPVTWHTCNNLSTPDTRPYYNLDHFVPTNGLTYLGLVMRGLMDPDPKNEDVTTKLLKPLYRDSTYYMSVDAVLVPYEYDNYDNFTLYYDNPSRIRISGGNDSCSVDEVLAVSDLITDTVWKRLYFKIIPTTNILTYLKIEIYLDTMRASYICLDNMTFDQLKIYGADTLCEGRNHVAYRVPEISCATDFHWNYTGTGATIIGNSDSIFINFDSTATSGILSVSFNNCGKGTRTLSLPITVKSHSSDDPGEIIGSDKVCAGQLMVSYQVAVSSTDNYNWSYTGNDVFISSVSGNATIDFMDYATSGTLQVSKNTGCDSYLPITVMPLPSSGGNLTGNFNLCPDQKGVIYTTPKIANATEYIWDYSGSGATIHGNSNSISIDFLQDATSGILEVQGKNTCGTNYPNGNYIDIKPLPQGPGAISGEEKVCQDEKNVRFFTTINNAYNYSWNYDGTGVTIKENSFIADLDFSQDATDGNLTVTGSNECGEITSPKFPITIEPKPSAMGKITGDSVVCQNQNEVIYSVPATNSATDYIWSYNGDGATISGSSNSVAIDFSPYATSGNLIVTGHNPCGTGVASPVFHISVEALPPAMEITGNNEVCVNHDNIFYVKNNENATGYKWNYSGNGAVMKTHSDTLNIKFTKIENTGALTVTGIYRCGPGETSLPVPIKVNLCDIHIPNAFTPNDDGINDLFVIRGLVENSKLVVFDRLGKIVYRSDNYQNDWDGTSLNGERLPSDTYWYVLTVEGVSPPFKGFIYLKR